MHTLMKHCQPALEGIGSPQAYNAAPIPETDGLKVHPLPTQRMEPKPLNYPNSHRPMN